MTTLRLLSCLLAGLFVAGCQTKPPDPMNSPLEARFFLEARRGDAGVRVQLPISQVTLTLAPKPVLVESDIVDVQVAKMELGWGLILRLTPAAGRDLYRLTAANLGRRLVMTFNDTAIAALSLDRPMTEGAIVIFPEVPAEDLPPLAERIKRTAAAAVKKGS